MRRRWHHPPALDGDADLDAVATNGSVQTLTTSTSTVDQPLFTPVTTLDSRGVPFDELVADIAVERERMLVEIAGYRSEVVRRLPRARRSAPRLGL